MTKRLFAALFFGILIIIISGCGFDENDEASGEAEEPDDSNDGGEDQSTVTLVKDSEIPTLDSSHVHDFVGFDVQNNVKEGLFRANENHIPELALAKEHETNDDETVHTFTLRDAEWSNGDPVTAQDFEFAWKRIFRVAGHYTDMFVTANIENAEAIYNEEKDPEELGVEAIDDKTLEVRLEKSNPLFKQLLVNPPFFPQNEEFVNEKGESYGTEADNVLYNGAYVLDSWNHDEGWTYKKNPDYWDADNVEMDEINVLIVKDRSTQVNLWETDELDYAQLSASYVDEYRDDESFQVDERASINFMRVNHNMELFQNADIRKSFDMSIDKEGLTETILNDGSFPLNGLVPEEFSFSPDDESDFRELNGNYNEGTKEDAQDLWEKGLSDLGMEEVEIDLTVSDQEEQEKMGEYVKEQLESNLEGLSIEINKVPFEARLEREKDVDYDMVISSWGPDYNDPMTFLGMWETGDSANRMDFSDQEYDDLIEQANVETDESKRYDMMLEAEKMLMDDMHILPLIQKGESMLKRTDIKDLIRHPAGPDYEYKHMYLE